MPAMQPPTGPIEVSDPNNVPELYGRHEDVAALAAVQHDASYAYRRMWRGARWQTGSVARASPVSANAWQRQPPKSISRPRAPSLPRS